MKNNFHIEKSQLKWNNCTFSYSTKKEMIEPVFEVRIPLLKFF